MPGLELEFNGPPNRALTAIMNGNELRAFALKQAQRAKDIYVSIVARGDDPRYAADRLYQSAEARTIKTSTRYGTRWSGELSVTSSHILPHEEGWETERDRFVTGEHDLNLVLEML